MGAKLGTDLAAMVDETLAEQFMDSNQKAAVIAGRMPRSEGRKQQALCQPEVYKRRR